MLKNCDDIYIYVILDLNPISLVINYVLYVICKEKRSLVYTSMLICVHQNAHFFSNFTVAKLNHVEIKILSENDSYIPKRPIRLNQGIHLKMNNLFTT